MHEFANFLIQKEAFVRFWLILGLLTAVLSGSVYFYIAENNADVSEFFYNFFLLSINNTTTELLSFFTSYGLYFVIPIGLKWQIPQICQYLCQFQDFIMQHMKSVSQANAGEELAYKMKWHFCISYVVFGIGMILCNTGNTFLLSEELGVENGQVSVLILSEY